MLNVHPIASMLNGPLVLATSVTWAQKHFVKLGRGKNNLCLIMS